MENKKVMTPSKFNRGIYLTPQVQYKLKEIACTYHVTLKSLMPALLWYVATNNKRYSNTSVPAGTRRLKHVNIDDITFDKLKIQACQHHLAFNTYLNIVLLNIFDEPYDNDTDEDCIQYFYESIIQQYQENMNASKCRE